MNTNDAHKEALLTDPWLSLLQNLSDNQIFIPNIPAEFREGLEQRGANYWTTRDGEDLIQMYLFRSQVWEILSGDVDPYFSLADTGHGVNSNTVTLNLVTKRAAIFLQFGYGPVYTNFVRCRLEIARGFLFLDRLLRSMPEGDGEVDFIVSYSNLRGLALLERDPSAPTEDHGFLGSFEGWSEVDYGAIAVSDGKSSSLDGQLFDWAEPLDFKLCAAKFLCSINEELTNGR